MRLGGKLLAPHIDTECLTRLLGEQHNIDQFALLEQIVRVGVPVDVGPGGNLGRELAYGNHSSADKLASEVCGNAVGDVMAGGVFVLPARLAGKV